MRLQSCVQVNVDLPPPIPQRRSAFCLPVLRLQSWGEIELGEAFKENSRTAPISELSIHDQNEKGGERNEKGGESLSLPRLRLPNWREIELDKAFEEKTRKAPGSIDDRGCCQRLKGWQNYFSSVATRINFVSGCAARRTTTKSAANDPLNPTRSFE